jgi:hypothetical protein
MERVGECAAGLLALALRIVARGADKEDQASAA